MATGGYIMLDMMGKGLREGVAYTIPGAYEKVESSVKSGKPLMLTNVSVTAYPVASDGAQAPIYPFSVRLYGDPLAKRYQVEVVRDSVAFAVSPNDSIENLFAEH